MSLPEGELARVGGAGDGTFRGQVGQVQAPEADSRNVVRRPAGGGNPGGAGRRSCHVR